MSCSAASSLVCVVPPAQPPKDPASGLLDESLHWAAANTAPLLLPGLALVILVVLGTVYFRRSHGEPDVAQLPGTKRRGRKGMAFIAIASAGALILGASVPAYAAAKAAVPVVKTNPIKVGTVVVTGPDGKAVAYNKAMKVMPGATATVAAPVSNIGKVPMKLYLSSFTLADTKKLGNVTRWQVTTSNVTKISGPLSGGPQQQFTVLKPGKSIKLAVKVQVPTSANNTYQRASLRYRLVLTMTQTT